MKKLILFLTLVLTTIISYGQLGDWLISIDSTQEVSDVALDDFGNTYVTGTGVGPGLWWPSGISTGGIVVNGSFYNSPHVKGSRSFITKIDSMGNMVWCKMMGNGPWDNFTESVVIDEANDVIFKVNFIDTLQIENDTMLTSGPWIPSSGPPEIRTALVKYDRFGNFIWASLVPSSTNYFYNNSYFGAYHNLITDQFNNIYFNFDTIASWTTPSSGGYVLKMNSNGILIDSFPRPLNIYNGFNLSPIAINKNQHIFTSWNKGDTLLVEYDSLGNLVSHLSYSGNGYAEISHLQIDSNNNVFALGNFNGPITIGGHNMNGIDAEFIFKMNSSGHVRWLKSFDNCSGYSQNGTYKYIGGLAVQDNDEILVAGSFRKSNFNDFNNICFDNDSFTSPILHDSSSVFIYKLDRNGDLIWSDYGVGEKYHYSAGIVKDNHQNIYVLIQEEGGDTLHFGSINSKATGEGGYLYKIKDGSNLISGQVFVDSNNNSTPNPSDRFFQNQIISLSGTKNGHVITNGRGLYDSYVLKGSYVTENNSPPKYHSSSPSSHNISFASQNQVDDDNHFVLTQTPGITDLRVHITPWSAFLSNALGRRAYINVDFFNDGSTFLSDTCVLNYDPKLEFISASIPPTDTSGIQLIWVFNNFAPYESVKSTIIFRIKSGVKGGDTLSYNARIGPIAIDTLPQNNTDSTGHLVTASYDPNDKQVQPFGDVKPKYVQDENYFNYTIRFQNTGTAPATYVRIRDSLDYNLELESFEMISSSHSYKIELINPRVLDFIFDPIFLPDSGANFKESMGYIKFRIKADPTLTHGDFFENTAYIYFDNNEPVVTNTTHTEISDWAGYKDHIAEEDGIFIFPNPAKSEFNIILNTSSNKEVDVVLTDLTGRVVYNERNVRMNSDVITLSNLNFKRGIYLVQVVQGGDSYNSKIVIQ